MQGAGKGTQAALIAEKYKIPHISTGELFRKIQEEDSELGRKVKEILSAGNHVPDDIVIEMLKKRLAEPDCKSGFILDGYPRTFAQAQILETITKIDCVLNVDISIEEAHKRLGSRIQCRNCQALFSTLENPAMNEGDSCPTCQGKLFVRDDDTPKAIQQRLATYGYQTGPIIAHYQKMRIFHNINGEQPVEKVFKDIQKILPKLKK